MTTLKRKNLIIILSTLLSLCTFLIMLNPIRAVSAADISKYNRSQTIQNFLNSSNTTIDDYNMTITNRYKSKTESCSLFSFLKSDTTDFKRVGFYVDFKDVSDMWGYVELQLIVCTVDGDNNYNLVQREDYKFDVEYSTIKSITSSIIYNPEGVIPVKTTLYNVDNTIDHINLSIQLDLSEDSLKTSNYVVLGEYHYTSKKIFGGANYTYFIKSNVFNLYNYAVELNAKNFEGYSYSEGITEARRILNDTETVSVTVEYLERIEGTPFARKRQTTYDVKKFKLNDELSTEKVLTTFPLEDAKKVMFSNLKNVTYDNVRKVYVFNYYFGANVTVSDLNGHFADYYYNPNCSFKEYYSRFDTYGVWKKDSGTGVSAIYDYYWNDLLNKYPVVRTLGLTDSSLYGYWGFIVIPQTYTINTALNKVFKLPDEINGSVIGIEKQGIITHTQYEKLLSNDFGYSYLSLFWNTAAGAVINWSTDQPATYYMIYVTETKSELEQGGVGKEETYIKSIFDNAVKSVSNFFSRGKTALTSILTLCLIIIGAIVAVKLLRNRS